MELAGDRGPRDDLKSGPAAMDAVRSVARALRRRDSDEEGHI